MARKPDKKGRDHREHGTYIRREFLAEPAFRAMSAKAQVLYFWLKLEWKGPNSNNNGKIRLSVRQAASLIGMGVNAANAAFHELQAKGFIVVTELGALGVEGLARGPSYELTELQMPYGERPVGRMLYKDWRDGNDFPILAHNTNNPMGRNGRKTPSSKPRRSCPDIRDVSADPVFNTTTRFVENSDVRPVFAGGTVIRLKTSLVTTTTGDMPPDLSREAGLQLCPLLATAS